MPSNSMHYPGSSVTMKYNALDQVHRCCDLVFDNWRRPKSLITYLEMPTASESLWGLTATLLSMGLQRGHSIHAHANHQFQLASLWLVLAAHSRGQGSPPHTLARGYLTVWTTSRSISCIAGGKWHFPLGPGPPWAQADVFVRSFRGASHRKFGLLCPEKQPGHSQAKEHTFWRRLSARRTRISFSLAS